MVAREDVHVAAAGTAGTGRDAVKRRRASRTTHSHESRKEADATLPSTEKQRQHFSMCTVMQTRGQSTNKAGQLDHVTQLCMYINAYMFV